MVASRLVGSILAGKYRVERVLREGGTGVVLAARHIEMEETVAVKLLHAQASSDAEHVARFIDEAKASARIRSDHVVRVRDAARLPDGRTYLVMELLEGLDLAEAVARDGPMPVSVAVDHVLQASEAIAEAHSMGLVHRALHPTNLFLTRRRNGKACVKVLDFGISRLHDADDAKEKADVIGAPLYRSPEQLVSAADVDARADVWSMGVVLYELLVGRTPFHATSLAELRHAILQQPAPDVRGRRPDVPAQVAEAIAAALAKRREERTGSIAELATALAPFASPVGREAFDALKATAARHLAPAPSVRMPVSSPRAPAPPSSPEPVTVGAPAGAAAPVEAATQSTFAASPQPRTKRLPLVAALLAVFGVLATVGALGIAWALMSRRPASAAPSAPLASAPAAPSVVVAPPPEPTAEPSTPATAKNDDPPAPSAAPSTSSASPPSTKTPAPRGTSKGRPRPHGGRR